MAAPLPSSQKSEAVPDDAETHNATEVNLKQTYSIVATNVDGDRVLVELVVRLPDEGQVRAGRQRLDDGLGPRAGRGRLMAVPDLSGIANAMIDLCRENELDREQSANVLAAVAASFCQQSGYSVDVFKALLDERFRTGQH